MRVFIWQSYGSDVVYEVPTDESMQRLINLIELAVRGWGIESEIQHLRQAHAASFTRAEVEIQKFFNRHRDHEAFEFGRFHNTKELS